MCSIALVYMDDLAHRTWWVGDIDVILCTILQKCWISCAESLDCRWGFRDMIRANMSAMLHLCSCWVLLFLINGLIGHAQYSTVVLLNTDVIRD